MAKVIAPNQHYSGLSATVMFVNGIGETDDEHLLQWFESKGYTVEWPGQNQEEPEQDIDKMTVPQLKEYAELNKIDLGDATKKEDILAAIQNAQQPVVE